MFPSYGEYTVLVMIKLHSTRAQQIKNQINCNLISSNFNCSIQSCNAAVTLVCCTHLCAGGGCLGVLQQFVSLVPGDGLQSGGVVLDGGGQQMKGSAHEDTLAAVDMASARALTLTLCVLWGAERGGRRGGSGKWTWDCVRQVTSFFSKQCILITESTNNFKCQLLKNHINTSQQTSPAQPNQQPAQKTTNILV